MKAFKGIVSSAAALFLLAASVGHADDAYPLPNCPISGEKLGAMGDPVVYAHEGREIRFCCGNCVGKFKADPETHLAKIDKEIADAQRAGYPLKTCAVSGEELGSMGDPIDVVVGNRLVRLCCKGCVKEAKKDPAAAIAKVDAAVVEQQKADYPLASCVVADEELGVMGEPIQLVHANRLVLFCCKGCVKKFKADPARYIAKIEEAAKLRAAVEEEAAKMAAAGDSAAPDAAAQTQTQTRER